MKSFRGKKPKKLDSAIARQIDENFSDTNNNLEKSPISTDVIEVCSKKII
jgi:hypothetical protein